MNKIILLIISYNEELNIKYLLDNCSNFVDDIFILDSYSEDKTLEIAKLYTKNIFFNKFRNFYEQRNYLLNIVRKKIPKDDNTWFLILDCDEYLSNELKIEIKKSIKNSKYDGFYIKRRFIWKNKWIKYGGYYPLKLLRLIRSNNISLDKRIVNEHYLCNSNNTSELMNDFFDHNRKPLYNWFKKHINYARFESKMYFSNFNVKTPKMKKWDKLPLLLRPFLLFFYRIFLKLGFLDGFFALFYHFLHSLVYRLLIDFYILKKIIFRNENT